jgi:hypothetical protein
MKTINSFKKTIKPIAYKLSLFCGCQDHFHGDSEQFCAPWQAKIRKSLAFCPSLQISYAIYKVFAPGNAQIFLKLS